MIELVSLKALVVALNVAPDVVIARVYFLPIELRKTDYVLSGYGLTNLAPQPKVVDSYAALPKMIAQPH